VDNNLFKTREFAASFLKANQGQRFTSREIAERIVSDNPSQAASKIASSSQELKDTEGLVLQVQAEIGSGRINLEKLYGIQTTTDRPRLYYYQDGFLPPEGGPVEDSSGPSLPEAETYPLLQRFLEEDRGLAAIRIDERRSSGRRGSGSGHWLHPDLVAIEDLSQRWSSKEARGLNKFYKAESIRVWAFEVKRELTTSNARSAYFQAVSNSGWANFGYLVATSVDERAFEEIEVLFGVHGIGLIKLDVNDPISSQILIPARERPKLDWNSVDRLAEENPDFSKFLKALETLHLTSDFDMVKAVLKS
jgi:hypothetical protein